MSNYPDSARRIMVALDYERAEEAKQLLNKLRGIPCYVKVGMQLFYAAGPDFILYLKSEGYRVFLDLKLHDIPNTVKGGANSITRLGVDMFNVHAAGGLKMMQAAVEGVDEAMAIRPSSGSDPGSVTYDHIKPIVIGVTQLTSTSQTILNDEIGIGGPIEEAVIRYAQTAKTAGLQGVVASPIEVGKIKERCGANFLTITPGIRPIGADIGDQSRVMTPKDAFDQGTDYVVIGRPITAAPDPRQALESIIESSEL
ncbi:MAG TPA: orotidine-5'-phosphate decarboxylase [Bacilli bacterium]